MVLINLSQATKQLARYQNARIVIPVKLIIAVIMILPFLVPHTSDNLVAYVHGLDIIGNCSLQLCGRSINLARNYSAYYTCTLHSETFSSNVTGFVHLVYHNLQFMY